MSLLQKAKKVAVRGRAKNLTSTKQNLELVVGWVTGEIGIVQLLKVLDLKGMGGYLLIARVLRDSYREGKLNISIKK